jgi:hypothetical protein
MKHRALARSIATAAAATLAMSLMAAPAVSAGSSSAGRDSTILTLNPYNNPNAAYLAGASCLITLSMADGTVVGSVSQCGQLITFTAAPTKLSIPATWPSPWGAPPQVEITNPDVLYTTGQTSLQISFSSPRRIAGFEISPQLGVVQSFKANYIDASGNLIGTINKTVSGGKARLIAAKTQASTKVSTIMITSNGDFAIARLRFKP